MTEINLIGGFYKSKTLPWSAQDVVNWVPVKSVAGGTRSPYKLRGLPGLRPTSANIISGLSITGDAPNTIVGATYSYSYTAAGGTPPYSFSIQSGFLPDGLSFSSAGVITGSATTEQLSMFSVGVADESLQTATLDDEIAVTSLSGAYWIGYGFSVSGQAIAVISPDGADWSGPANIVGADTEGVIATGGSGSRVIAIQDDIEVRVSSDAGSTWSSATLPAITGLARKVFFTAGRFHAATPASGMCISDNMGSTWSLVTLVNAGQASVSSLVEVGGSLYGTRGADKISVSTNNGSSWDETGTSVGFSVAYFIFQSGTIVVGASTGALNRVAISSSLGASWSTSTIPISSSTQIRTTCTAAGSGAWVVANADGEIAYSSNGTTWTKSTFAFPDTPRALDYGNGRFVLVGNSGAIAYSDNGGANWTAVPVSTFSTRDITALAYIQ